jgi:hypothetical protein
VCTTAVPAVCFFFFFFFCVGEGEEKKRKKKTTGETPVVHPLGATHGTRHGPPQT